MILFLNFLLSLILIDKIYQTLKTVFDHIKHLKVHKKYSTMHRVSTLFLVFGNMVKHGLSCLMYYLKTTYNKKTLRVHFNI